MTVWSSRWDRRQEVWVLVRVLVSIQYGKKESHSDSFCILFMMQFSFLLLQKVAKLCTAQTK